MLSSETEVAQSLKSNDIFRTLSSGSLSLTAMLNFLGEANTSIHGLGEEDTAILGALMHLETKTLNSSIISVVFFSCFKKFKCLGDVLDFVSLWQFATLR